METGWDHGKSNDRSRHIEEKKEVHHHFLSQNPKFSFDLISRPIMITWTDPRVPHLELYITQQDLFLEGFLSCTAQHKLQKNNRKY